MVKDKEKPQSKDSNRQKLEQAAVVLCQTQKPRYERVEALGTLLSAYALGSRTATRGLEEYARRFPGWNLPTKEKAMTMANEAFREAENLRKSQGSDDTLPGY